MASAVATSTTLALDRGGRLAAERTASASTEACGCAGREAMDFNYNVSFDSTGKVDTMALEIDFDGGW